MESKPQLPPEAIEAYNLYIHGGIDRRAFFDRVKKVAVSTAAMRLGALDMAVANLFGSNLFNVAVLGVDDLLYTDGVLLARVSLEHIVTATAAMMMTGIAIIGLTYRAARKRFHLSWDAVAIAAVYVLTMTLLAVSG